MSLERLARELEETARQTGEMAHEIYTALDSISAPGESAARGAVQQIVVALQAQDRIEQRCHNLAAAVRALIARDGAIDHAGFDEIWSGLKLDELALPEFSGIAARVTHGECDLF